MANSYTQVLIQFVFAVKYRKALVTEYLRVPLEKYITGIVTANNHKLLAIFCMPDHCHILVGMKPKQSISDLARVIKTNSSKWINQEDLVKTSFHWQPGFGAFSYSIRQLDIIVNYILNQKDHHGKKDFSKEFRDLLEQSQIDYDERYIFQPLT